MMTFSSGASDNQYSMYVFTSGYYTNIRTNATSQGDPGRLTTPTVGAAFKMATASQLNDAITAANGTAGTQDTSVLIPNGINQLRIGASPTGAAVANTTIKKIAYYTERLTNAELAGLTTI
jgi:hypothetical protein